MKKPFPTTGIICPIVLVVTLAIFLLLVPQPVLIDWVGLGFLLLPEAVFFGGLILTDRLAQRHGGLFLRAGAYTVLTLYTVAAIAAALLFLTFFRGSPAGLAAVELILLALCVILLLLFYRSGGYAQRSEDGGSPPGKDGDHYGS